MTRKELESVYCLQKELIMWQLRRQELEYDIAVSPKVLDGMPFQNTNVTGDPTQLKAIKLAEVAKVIDGKISELQITLAEIEAYILSIDDTVMRQILEYRCIKCMDWNRVAQRLGAGYTDESVRQTYHRFITVLE